VICIACGREASVPVSLTPEVHDLYCAEHFITWIGSAEFRLVVQLVALKRMADAISQYRHFQSRLERERRTA
jgi:hypothetical protein